MRRQSYFPCLNRDHDDCCVPSSFRRIANVRRLHRGSGAGGGCGVFLTRSGAILLLEAGGPWDNTKDSAMLKMPYESPRRGASTVERPFGEFDACVGGWELQGEPFTVAEGQEFRWWRARMVGGRTNHWGRISLRFGPDDFKAKSRDGLGDDWPIGYEDIAPYYDRIDKLIGIFGNNQDDRQGRRPTAGAQPAGLRPGEDIGEALERGERSGAPRTSDAR